MSLGTPRELIARHDQLASLPEIVLRLNEMVNDPRMSAADIGAVISQDPALSARLLKIVNSPLYNFPSQIDSISLAVTIVGIRQLRDLVLATAVIRQFSRLSAQPLDIELFWRHSLTTAVVARTLARHMKVANTERYFIAGLLHDIGLLLLAQEPQALMVQKPTAWEAHDPLELEQSIFGFTHAELGAELLRYWLLPASLVEPVAHHHNPRAAGAYIREAACVNLANSIAQDLQPALPGERQDKPSQFIWDNLALTPDQLPAVLEEVGIQLEEAMQLLYYNQAA